MEVVKDEVEEAVVVNELEIKNSSVKHLLQYYVKVANTDFESKDFDTALALMEDSIKIEDAYKAYRKLEEVIIEKAKKKTDIDGNISNEIIEKVNSDLFELSDKFTKIKGGLTKIPDNIYKKISAKPIELKILKENGVI